ncbi:alpha/beta hydrolase [Neosynechococcus sphagnicola sy1]|uniref:Alpha/beta hydrolase n=1 Tax=Neosynechococcus sphagnicola sy1 TaxID=1497020 RepID=A0A098TJ27_9CYAN|nr:alpha/beta hydrolase [Neosynechococcus sphagnicola]KGF72056.1 alpha/beta hydrolase [Neosynechococcus sphagnicola sy1]
MLQFQPPGFGQRQVKTSLGVMVYYAPLSLPWQRVPESGSGSELVFLHNFGGGASAYEWSKVYPAFAATHRVLAPDLIGWGQSAHPLRDYQLSDYLITLVEFIERACHPPVTVLASSFTGALTIRLAIQRPELFQALYLVCPAGFKDFGQEAGRRLPLELIGTPLVDQIIYALGAANEFAVRNFLQQFLFAKPERISDEMVAAFLASAQQPGAEYAALAFLKGNLYFDLALYLPQLSIPTRFFWGTQAQFTPLALGRRLAQLNPEAVVGFEAIAGAGVLPHLEVPEIVIGLMNRHLGDRG